MGPLARANNPPLPEPYSPRDRGQQLGKQPTNDLSSNPTDAPGALKNGGTRHTSPTPEM